MPDKEPVPDSDLVAYLKQITEFFKPPMCPLERLVLEVGKDFIPAKRPRGLRKQRDKQCYANSLQLALQRNDLVYVEGYAIHDNLIPLFHAWCATQDDTVVDVTWRYPERSVYRGVIIPKELLLKTILTQETYGVLDNGLGINLEIIEQLRQQEKRT